MSSDASWAKAQADYRLGATLASICKKHKLKMRELLQRIRAEGWLRQGEKSKAVTIPAAEDSERTDRVNEAIDEAITDIIVGHRSISREMRENLENEIAEYQELKQYLVSALDKDYIAELQRNHIENGNGTPNAALMKYVQDCMVAFGKRVTSLDKLVRLATLLIQNERTVWGIDSMSDGGADTENYDDLLELCRAPVGPRVLPEGVADFERKLRQRESMG